MMRTRLIRPWRRLVAGAEAAIVLGLPFLTIDGQSALRFDVPALRLYFFGTSIGMDQFFLVLLAVLFILFLFIGFTMLFGRLWCGWVCPQTVLCDLIGGVTGDSVPSFSSIATSSTRGVGTGVTGGMAPSVMGYLRRAAGYLLVAVLSALVAANIIWYFVSPYDFVQTVGASSVVRSTWFWLAVIIFIDLAFIRRIFCATVCPYARLQSVLYDNRTLRIAYDPALQTQCMGCAACWRACPVGIDIREGESFTCINCAQCIDACTRMRAAKGRESLIGYHWKYMGSLSLEEGTQPQEEGTQPPQGEGTQPQGEGTQPQGEGTQPPQPQGEGAQPPQGEGTQSPQGEDNMSKSEGSQPQEEGSQPPQPPRFFRVNVLIAFIGAAVFLALLVYGSITRSDFNASLRLDPAFAPRVAVTRHGTETVTNAYLLSLRNHTDGAVSYAVRFDGRHGNWSGAKLLAPEPLELSPDGAGEFSLYVSLERTDERGLPDEVSLEIVVAGVVEAVPVSAAFVPPAPQGAGAK